MRIPFLSSKREVIKGVQYANTVVIKYVLPKRELVKIGVLVIGLELMIHAPVRKAWADKVEEKIGDWVGTPDYDTDSTPGSFGDRRTRN